MCLHSGFKTSLDFIIPCLKISKREEEEKKERGKKEEEEPSPPREKQY